MVERTQTPGSAEAPIRVVRIISRLNIGGPAIQAISLTRLLEARGYASTLVRGAEGADEGNMDYLAVELGVRPLRVPTLKRELGVHDIPALVTVIRTLRRLKPDVVHTHAAKGGTIGRLAAMLAGRGRPRVTVHTFHGHVFTGVFSPAPGFKVNALASRLKVALFVRIERWLARRTTRLIAVSDEVRDDLIELGIAPPEKIEVVRLGFDLSRFRADHDQREAQRASVRGRLGIPLDAQVVTLIARVVRMKRVDRFLEVASLLRDLPNTYFVIAGDGELRQKLESSQLAREVADRVIWAGFQRDVPAVCFASDVVALTSDNEGTPVCLIEAQAARVPVVSTEVGGVATVVDDGRTGRVVRSRDPGEIAAGVREILEDPALAERLGAEGQAHVANTFSVERLVSDIDSLYRRLLSDGR
jgi:glycosyltransferase involved in cell wall biosynthesis